MTRFSVYVYASRDLSARVEVEAASAPEAARLIEERVDRGDQDFDWQEEDIDESSVYVAELETEEIPNEPGEDTPEPRSPIDLPLA